MHLRILAQLIFILPFWANAQPVFSEYPDAGAVLVYKISSKEATRLYSQRKPQIEEKYLHSPIDSISPAVANKRQYPAGHYIYCHANRLQEVRQLWTFQGFQIRPQSSKGEMRLQVVDENSLPVTDAEVTWRGKALKHLGDGIYRRKTDKRRGLVSVRRGEEEYLGWWYDEHGRVDPMWAQVFGHGVSSFGRVFTKPFSKQLRGYIAFSRPQYRPGDTLRSKAYLVNQYGKPVRRKLHRSFYSYMGKGLEISAKVKPESPGVFIFDLPLPDSLELDRNFFLGYEKNSGKGHEIYSKIRYEDYLLKEASFSVEVEESSYRRGDSVQVRIEALDANGLGIANAEFGLKVRLGSLFNFAPQKAFIPSILWEYQGKTGDDGSSVIQIPGRIFIDLRGFFDIEGTLRTASNEILESADYVLVDGLGGLEETFLLEEGNLVTSGMSGDAVLIGMAGEDTLAKTVVTMPLELPADTLADGYILFTPSDIFSLDFNERNGLWATGMTYGDSVAFSVNNQHGLRFRYKISKGKKLIESGESSKTSWDWKKKVADSREYGIEVAFYWAGKPQVVREFAQTDKNGLKIDLKHPQRVQPGETVQMEVKVSDFKGNPVPYTNLASGGVTDRITGSKGYSALRFPNKETYNKRWKTRQYRELDREVVSTVAIDSLRADAMRLDSLDWYKMLNPPNGWYIRYLPTPDQTTQFAPFFTRNDLHSGFNAIWIDGRLVWHIDQDSPENYTLRLEPGFHHLRLRNSKYELEVENVNFPEGQKLELFLRPNDLPEFCRVREVGEEPTYNLSRKNHDYQLWFFDSDSGRFGRAGQGNKQVLLGGSAKWRSTGIIQEGPVWVLPAAGADTVWVNFQPGYKYVLRDGFLYRDSIGGLAGVRNYFSDYYQKPGEFSQSEDLLERLQAAGTMELPIWDNDSWEDEEHDCSLVLQTAMTFETAYIVVIREEDRSARVFRPEEITLKNLLPGKYRIWRCKFNGTYEKGKGLKISDKGTYLLQINEDDFEPGNRPDELIGEKGLSLDLNLFEKQYLPGASGILSLQVIGPMRQKFAVREAILVKGDYFDQQSFTTDESGKIALALPVEGWYHFGQTHTKDNRKASFSSMYYWRPGEARMHSISMPHQFRSSDGISRIAFRRKFLSSINFRTSIIPRLFARKFRNMPPRRGTRTNYINDFAGGDDIEYGMISKPFTDVNDPETAESTAKTNRLRDNFADEAWWQPNLSTDENGEAVFQVTFPDDLTKWNAWVVGMNRRRQSGEVQRSILSYRELVARLSVPRFLISGDETELRGEVVNRTGDISRLSTSFEVAGKASEKKVHAVDRQMDEGYSLTAVGDSIQAIYRLEREDGYGDGESRPIAVLSPGIIRKTGGYAYLDALGNRTDSILTIQPNPNLGPVRLIAEARPIDYLMSEIEKLEKYPYSCMEQTSSRLMALLAKRSIATAMSERFRQNDEIKSLIRRLENAQQSNGAWGWWFESKPNLFMTAVVCQALRAAVEQGYSTKALGKGKSFLMGNISREANADNLRQLFMAAELGIELDYGARLGAYGVRKLSIYDRLQIARIRQLTGLPFDWSAVWASRKESISGGLYWGDKSDDLLTNSVQATLIVYRMLEKMPDKKLLQARLRRFLLEQGEQGLGRNTFESASVLTALVPYYLSQPYRKSDGVVLDVSTNGKIQRIDAFPAEKTMRPESFRVRKSGRGPVFLHWYQEKRTEVPELRSTHFKVSSHFEQAGKNTENPVLGEALSLVVNVKAVQSASYVMVEVPIPAGCVYGDRSLGIGPGEVHREYFRDRVSIFFTELPEGAHTFRIDLEPRFPGKYTLNPVEVKPMYFPLMSGNNEVRKVEIR